jgi:hypothetical protein
LPGAAGACAPRRTITQHDGARRLLLRDCVVNLVDGRDVQVSRRNRVHSHSRMWVIASVQLRAPFEVYALHLRYILMTHKHMIYLANHQKDKQISNMWNMRMISATGGREHLCGQAFCVARKEYCVAREEYCVA